MRLLILHDCREDFADWLVAQCPEHEIRWATGPEQVPSALEEFQPEGVLSIKHPGFDGPAHKEAFQHPSVRWFHVGGSGFEHLGSWDPERVTVTNSVGVLAAFHAERAMAGLLALSTGLLPMLEEQAGRRWTPSRFATLQGRTLLIVGVGRTGGELATRARAFGMRLLGVRASGEPHPDVEQMFCPEELPELWGRADVVSLNLRVDHRVHHLVDGQALAAMKPGALLLNGARGAAVDTEALIEVLRSGRLAGAWLDVFEEEPLPSASPLWALPNVIVTAHCADQVQDFPLRFARQFAENLKRLERGESLFNVCRPC